MGLLILLSISLLSHALTVLAEVRQASVGIR